MATTGEIGLYAQELYAEVHDHASEDDGAMFLPEAFTDLVLDSLEEEGIWPGSQLAHFEQRGIGLSAWGLESEGNETLFLSVTDFRNSDEVATISKTEINTVFRRLINFFERCSEGKLALNEHSAVKDIADVIEAAQGFTEVRLYLLTNRLARSEDPDPTEFKGIPISYKVWDLESIRRSLESGIELEPIDINLVEQFGEGLPYLTSSQQFEKVKTYLAFVPGQIIADLYREFGARLLERNVRSFLMAKTKVNRGIRDTLAAEPERFLAYNNGLTATASKVEIDDSQSPPKITGISDLQIVNGGQTTASIAAASRDPEVQIGDVSVQVKLAVVDPKVIEELVPNISKYANSQNSISESDLAANHDYLTNLELASRSLWTPAVSGAKPTRWYFERAKGSYNVDKANAGTTSLQKKFSKDHPTSQKIDKNYLAIYENTWALLPHMVCRGGQKNFVEFLERQGELGDLTQNDYQQHYRDLAAKAKLFKTTDKHVYAELGGTYKRQVTVYALAHYLQSTDHAVDLKGIWRTQQVPQLLQANLLAVATGLKNELIDSGHGKNITEWSKQEACWKHLQTCDFDYPNDSEEFRDTQEVRTLGALETFDPGDGQSLLVCIYETLGFQLQGKILKRYKTETWQYLGLTGVYDEGAPLHAFRSHKTSSDGNLNIQTVFVNDVSETLTLEEHLNPLLKDDLKHWILH